MDADLLWFLGAFAAGLLLPAPYDAIAKSIVLSLWDRVKARFGTPPTP